MEQEARITKTTFLIAWLLLIILTFALLAIGTSSMASPSKHLWIFMMMAVQAYLVAFYFMHLRFERLPLILSVLLGVLLTAGLLYAVMVWDGSRIVRLTVHP